MFKCLTIISVNKDNYTINGDFIEKYLTLFLKLKCVISAGGINFNYINNIFFNIDYINYICVGHGVSFFKYFLYESYSCYGNKMYDKILIPPSEKLISVAKNHGWDDKNIIKLNLPRWDKYNIDNETTLLNPKIKNNSVYLMFTWRKINTKKYISKYYFNNILNLLNNKTLKNILVKNNINLYFTLHHKLSNIKNKLKLNKYIQYIEEQEISFCLKKTSLLITDFSSIIFDIIYRKKPFIIYIPDADDPDLKIIYDKNYYELIDSLKNGTLYFKNIFFDLERTINNIIYYINNNFKLDQKLEYFYNSFNLKKEMAINKIIDILKK